MNALFAPEYARASIILLALMCVVVVAGLFAYLGRKTRRACYTFWTISCLFYAVYHAAVLGFHAPETNLHLAMLVTMCLGLSAVFMLWGNFDLQNVSWRRTAVWGAVVTVILSSYVGIFELRQPFWAMLPPLVLLGGARVHAGILYQRHETTRHGPNLLALAFVLWGVQTLTFPLLVVWPAWMATAYLASAVLMLLMAIGVIVEQEVALTEQKYRGVLEACPDAIFMVDLWTLEVLDTNPRAEQLLKYASAALVGRDFLEICPKLRQEGGSRLDHREMFNAVFNPHNEFHLVRGNGDLVLCEGETSLMQWQKRLVVQIRVREVGSDQKINQMVRRAEKMSALGQFIAGVAHELNNPLAVVVAYAELLAKRPAADAGLRADLEKIRHESECAAKIVRDLLSFARPCEPRLETVNLNELVDNVLIVRDAQFRAYGITVKKNLAASLPLTQADPAQIEQVLTNLVTNAIQAMTGRSDPRQLTVTTEESGFALRITVADSGPGIAPEVAHKIFEPFFTTKPPGQGTGLGLAISHTILEEHKGKIWVESQPGRGAKFLVELPLVPCAAPPAPAGGADQAALEPAPTDARLLIVDDEPGIREVLQAVLEGNGYATDTAVNGKDALQQMERHRYDVIFSDRHMPEMNGEQMYAALQARDPQLARRVVFVTGDTVGPQVRAFLDRTRSRWISKPFNIRAVEQLVRDLVREARSTEAKLAQIYATTPKRGKVFQTAGGRA